MAQKRYYVRVRGKVLGPFDLRQLRQQRDRGRLNRFHELSEDRVHWVPASSVAELFGPEEAPRSGRPEATGITPARPREEGAVAPADAAWHYTDRRGKQVGPVTRHELLDLLDEGAIDSETLVWNPSLPEWVPLASAPGLLDSAPAPRRPLGGVSPLALGSLIAAVVWCGGLGSAAAVVLGLLALREAGRRKGQVKGRGLALAGTIAGGAGVALTLLAVLAAAFYSAFRGPETHTPETIAAEYKDKVYILESRAGKGSGILLANSQRRGLIATNLHVINPKLQEDKVLKRVVPDGIKDTLTVEVKNPSQLNTKKANLAAFHRDLDLALLVLEMDNAQPDAVAVVRQKSLRDGESAVAIGFPLGIQPSTTNGIISNPRGESGLVWTTCPISPGNSGGPLFIQRNGLLAGLNTGSFVDGQNFNGAVPAEQIVFALREGHTSDWVWKQELKDDVVELAKKVPLVD
jgi:S1-C subfamily serine protease